MSQEGMSRESGPWLFIYGFFLLHMAMFGTVGFVMAYGAETDLVGNIMFSGFAITVYLLFYLVIFGRDSVMWLIINSVLGVLGIMSQLGWILGHFGKTAADYPSSAHVIPFIYYVLYTFLLRRLVLHVLRAQDGTRRKIIIDISYVVVSLLVYLQPWKMLTV